MIPAIIVVVACLGLQPLAAGYGPDTVAQGNRDDLRPGYRQRGQESVKYVEVVSDADQEFVSEVTTKEVLDLQEFRSIEEMENWLASDDTNEYIYVFTGEDGVSRYSDRYDCDDYAIQLQRRAVSSGYLISVTLVDDPGQGLHMINLAIVGNDIYYIEPQTDEAWFYTHLD